MDGAEATRQNLCDIIYHTRFHALPGDTCLPRNAGRPEAERVRSGCGCRSGTGAWVAPSALKSNATPIL